MIEFTCPTTWGHTLDAPVIERGLLELNPDIHFDLAGAIGQWHPHILYRQGVYYYGQHVTPMDRGLVPEFKQWDQRTFTVEVPWSEADRDGVSITYVTILRSDPRHDDFYALATKGWDPEYAILDDGRLCRRKCIGTRTLRGRVRRVGWRHTFERLLQRGIPNVTRQTLAAKFHIDMMKFPVGPPEEVMAALMEE